MGWRRAMKFCRVVDLGVHQVFSPFGELWPRGHPLKPKSEKFGNAYLVDRLRDRAENLQDGRSKWVVGRLRFW